MSQNGTSIYGTERPIHVSDYVDSDDLFNTIVAQISDQQPPKSTPTSTLVIKNLPITTIKTRCYTKTTTDSTCAICKDEFMIDDRTNALPCKHLFHVECIVPWLNLNNTCPLCRHKLPERKFRKPRRRRSSASSWLLRPDLAERNRQVLQVRRMRRVTRSMARRVDHVVYDLRNRSVLF